MKKTTILTLALFLALALVTNTQGITYITDVMINESCEAWNSTLWTAWNDVTIPFNGYYSYPNALCRLTAGVYAQLDSNPTYKFDGDVSNQTNGDAMNLSYSLILGSAGTMYAPSYQVDNNGSLYIRLTSEADRYFDFEVAGYPKFGDMYSFLEEYEYVVNMIIYDNCSIIISFNGTETAEVYNCSYKEYEYNISTKTQGFGWSHVMFDNLVLWQNYSYGVNTHLNIFDETNDTQINYTTTTINIISDNYNLNYTTENGTFHTNLEADNYEIRYKPGNHTERSYYLTLNHSGQTVNITMYSLLNETGYFPIIVNVLDQYSEPVPGAFVQALRFFPNSTTPYKLVATRETDQNGQAALDLELYTAWYKFQVIHNDQIKVRDGARQIFDTSWTYYLSTAEDYYGSYGSIGSLLYYFEFLNDTNQFRLEWTDTSGYLEQICLDVMKTTRISEEGICYNCSNSATGILYCDVTDDNQSSYIAKLRYNSNTEFSDYVDTLSISFNRVYQTFGLNTLFYVGIAFLAFSTLGFLLAGIVGGLGLGLVGGIISISLTKIIDINWVGIGSTILLFIIIIIILARRRGE